MRAYAAASEEILHARNLIKDWASQGFLTDAQYKAMEQETVCDLRRTNVFLRIVLFFFTLIIVGAAVALFFVVILSHPASQTSGIVLLIFAAISYAAAEFAVTQARLYRYGIEEALAACSVAFLCVGMQLVFIEGHSPRPAVGSLIPATGTIASLWVWHRFGLPYAFLAAMIFGVWLPSHWTTSHSAQHLIVAAFYALALVTIAAVRTRYRFTYLDETYSIAEALLWIGIYLAINLQLSSFGVPGLLRSGLDGTSEFSRPFYWTTWALTWCLPPVALARGLRQKDRFVIAAGAIASVLTLVTNKPYLGWPRRTWDPMLLGALMFAVALLIRRWLAAGPAGIRRGFTAQRLSAKDKSWLSAGATAIGFVAPQAITPPQPSPEFQFGGGDSGGGGASSDF
jgi:uncharacterized membrane protein YgcG